MKKIALLFLLAIPLFVNAQDVAVADKDGVFISYKLTKIKEDTKKETYLISVKASNKNDYDVYYEGPTNKVNPFFCTLTIRNTKDNIYLTGSESRLMSVNKPLFYIKRGSYVSADKEVKVDKGSSPVLTADFLSELKDIVQYR